MSKDMNVTIQPLWFNGLDGTCYADMGDRLHPVNVDYQVLRKQLKDTELAAEYWHAALPPGTESHTEMVDIAVIKRFATTPSYHQEAQSGGGQA
ncbi:hypothetical protein [Arthrobacter sp. H14]|uniref:hypothetical protein n=1 Tax=Arthrobacter sp. H14 TaxID=1312959 RepID=UPI00047D77B0|nr:hypothetical protein [Arthrobacter sp. H14]